MSWRTTTIGEHCTVTSSKRFHLSERSESGVPFYCSKEIIQKYRGEEITECDYIREEFYLDVAKRFGVPQENDLLVTTRGTIGIPYLYHSDDRFYFADGNLTWIKDFKETLLPQFLYYWFLTHEGQKKVDAIAKGTAQKAVPIAGIKTLELNLPDITTQHKVVEILSSYDALIENNQKQIKLLEEAAQRLYKEWFVDLRFPGYETTPITDGIPEGWKEGIIQDVVVYHDKKRKPLSGMQRAEMQGQYRYYGAASILDYVNDYLFDGTYLLLGEDGTVVTEDGFPILQYVTGKFWANNHAHVLTGQPDYPTEYLYMMFKATKVKDVVTGAAQPKISQARLSNKKMIIPCKELVRAYCDQVNPIFKQILNLEQQIILHKEARDRLLPKLMNGEIEV